VKKLMFSGIIVLTTMAAKSQATMYLDPALVYQKLMLEKGGEANVQKIGNFKVKGTQYLYGGYQTGDVYFKNGSIKNVSVSYDTYRQLLAIHVGDKGQSLVKQLNELDSFFLKADQNTSFKTDLKFVNVGQYDSTKKVFLQVVSSGPRFNLYKAYKSDLAIVSENYIQSDLRQFDLNYEYYYIDAKSPGLKKLKQSAKALKKEFGDIKDISSIVNDEGFGRHLEASLMKIFSLINS
jgi:hypothetical protein